MAGPLRVLVLEDRPADAELMIRELRQGGFDPDWERAATKEQYLAHLGPDLDLILADYTLARFNAVEALRLLRKRRLDIPFIVVTDTVEEEAAVACLKQGADDYLLKDRLARLGPAVGQALEAKRLHDERRRAEREARVSARQWQATFNAISDPIFLLDAGGRIARCNQAAGEFAGRRISSLVGRSCCEVVHGASGPIEGCPYRRALETQRREAQVWQRGTRWFEAVVDPMLDDEDYLVGFVYVLEEITERKQTEQALRRRNRELSLLNQAGRTLNTSLELEEVLGAVLEEVRGLLGVVGCSAWLQDPETDELVCRQVTGLQSEVARGWRLAPGQGVVGWVVDRGESLIVPDAQRDERHFKGMDEETGLPIRSLLSVPLQVKGNVIGALQAVDTEVRRFDSRDRRLLEALAAFAANAIQNARLYEQADAEIARRGRAEAALQASEERLKESERRFRLLFEEAPIAYQSLDEDGRLLVVNQAWLDLLRYSRQDVVGRWFGAFIAPEQQELFRERLGRFKAADEIHDAEFELVREDGTHVIVSFDGAIGYDERGSFRQTHCTMQDVTERKRAQEALERRVTELGLLNEVGRRIAGELDLDTVLNSAVSLVKEEFGYYQVVVLTVDQEQGDLVVRAKAGGFAELIPDGYRQALDEGVIGWVASQGEALLVNDVEGKPRYLNRYPDQVLTQAELSVPIRRGDDVVGVLDVQSEHRDAFDQNDLMVMGTVADQIAVAMQNAQLYEAAREAREQLRDLASYLQEAREKERTRIAREIHDQLGQMMTALKIDLSWLLKRLPVDDPQARERAEAMEDVVHRAFDAVRRISSELRPGLLDDLGLAAAIEWQAEAFSERSGVDLQLHLDEAAETLNRELSTALFRILQEALTNVARHAEATEVRIDLRVEPEDVTLIVADNGRGALPEEITSSRSLGLLGMQERARALGGEVTVEGVPEQGTTVTARMSRREAWSVKREA